MRRSTYAYLTTKPSEAVSVTKLAVDKLRPKISVCIVTYNQESYIENCLLGVLTQSCDADLEVLVGDDHSTDSTRAVIERVASTYPGRLTVPVRSRNLGGPRNYQDLVARASGDYIAHLDGDDYWLPGKLAAQLAFIRAHPQCVAVFTNAVVIEEGGQRIGVFNNTQPKVFDRKYLLWGGNFLNHSSILYRSAFKDALLGLHEDFIDYHMHLRLARYGKFGYVNELLVAYRKGSVTSSSRNSLQRVLKRYWKALCDTDVNCAGRSHAMAKFLVYVVYVQVRSGRVRQAIKWVDVILKEAGKRAPGVLAIGAWEGLSGMALLIKRKTRLGQQSGGLILYRR